MDFDNMEENFKVMVAKDRINKGKLVGRFIREPHADGAAYYEITKELQSKVRIKVITGIGDDWEIPYWGESALINKDYATHSVNSRDRMDELFSQSTRVIL